MDTDTFHILAPYYDRIMSRVRYDLWEKKIISLQQVLPSHLETIHHLDIACGTGTLIHRIQKYGWRSVGIDLSHSMIAMGKEIYPSYSFCVADMRRLPFIAHFSIASCLFDSINFLLDEDDVFYAIRSAYDVLIDGGIFYFDCVTEEMVKQHYGNDEWKESYKDFKTTWKSTYNPLSRIATLSILIQGKGWTVVRQKLYPIETFTQAIQESGFQLLACVDAHTWDYLASKTVRVDFVCGKNLSEQQINKFKQLHQIFKDEFKSQYFPD